MEKSLRVLRLEHERVISSLNKQVELLTNENASLQLVNQSSNKNSSKESSNSNEAKEIERIRNFYTKKVKALEAKLTTSLQVSFIFYFFYILTQFLSIFLFRRIKGNCMTFPLSLQFLFLLITLQQHPRL